MSDKDYEIVEELFKIADELKRTVSQVALRWCIQRNFVSIPLIGCRKLSQLEDSLGALEFQLTEEQVARLDSVTNYQPGYPHDFLGGVDYHHIKWLSMGPNGNRYTIQ